MCLCFSSVQTNYFDFLIAGRPPAPTNLQPIDIKPTSAKITWDPPTLHKMYSVALYYIQYKEFGSNIKTWKSAPVTSLSYTLTSLKSGASYMVRAKSQNDYGAGDPSDVLEITTIKGKKETRERERESLIISTMQMAKSMKKFERQRPKSKR